MKTVYVIWEMANGEGRSPELSVHHCWTLEQGLLLSFCGSNFFLSWLWTKAPVQWKEKQSYLTETCFPDYLQVNIWHSSLEKKIGTTYNLVTVIIMLIIFSNSNITILCRIWRISSSLQQCFISLMFDNRSLKILSLHLNGFEVWTLTCPFQHLAFFPSLSMQLSIC